MNGAGRREQKLYDCLISREARSSRYFFCTENVSNQINTDVGLVHGVLAGWGRKHLGDGTWNHTVQHLPTRHLAGRVFPSFFAFHLRSRWYTNTCNQGWMGLIFFRSFPLLS
jgi:hypothetical protein